MEGTNRYLEEYCRTYRINVWAYVCLLRTHRQQMRNISLPSSTRIIQCRSDLVHVLPLGSSSRKTLNLRWASEVPKISCNENKISSLWYKIYRNHIFLSKCIYHKNMQNNYSDNNQKINNKCGSEKSHTKYHVCELYIVTSILKK